MRVIAFAVLAGSLLAIQAHAAAPPTPVSLEPIDEEFADFVSEIGGVHSATEPCLTSCSISCPGGDSCTACCWLNAHPRCKCIGGGNTVAGCWCMTDDSALEGSM